jgi:hypothetical protein
MTDKLTPFQQSLMDAARHYASAVTFFDTASTNQSKIKATKEARDAKAELLALVLRAVDLECLRGSGSYAELFPPSVPQEYICNPDGSPKELG